MIKGFSVGRHRLGPDRPTYFIADIAANHDGDLQRAVDLIHLCAEAGADAAKFQNFRVETIVSDYGFRALGGQQSHQANWEKSVFKTYRDASLPMEWTEALAEACKDADIDYFTAPYDLDLLPALSRHVACWKVGSGDVTWIENIEAMAADGKPVFLATGASTMDDVERAVAGVRKHTDELCLMQCNTNYTGSLENFRFVELNVLKQFAERFPDVLLGLSDHTPGHAAVLGAVALGARAVEKHFTDDVTRSGPDHPFSMDPTTWRDMVERTRELELALGRPEKRIMENEAETVVLQRRAIRARRPIAAGATIHAEDLIPLRPCPEDALPPYRMSELIGRKAARAIDEGDCVRRTDIA
jgi:sialic acid synthase SpsE